MYWPVRALIGGLQEFAEKFASKTKWGSSMRQQQEISHFLRTVYFDFESNSDLGRAFPLINDKKPNLALIVSGLIGHFQDKQTKQVIPALNALDIPLLSENLALTIDSQNELVLLKDGENGLGDRIPRYLERYVALPAGHVEYDGFLRIYKRVDKLNRTIGA